VEPGVKRTCVLGGGGFIGQHVVRRLLTSGRDVVVVGRRASSPLEAGIEYRSVQPDAPKALQDVLASADEVVDLSYSTWPQTSFQDPVKDIHDNLAASVRVFEFLLETNVRRVVYVSSGGTVYGHAQRTPITEDHPTNPVSPYGITKLAIEKYGHMFHATKGLPIVIVRPSNAYGEGQQPFRGQGFVSTAIASCLRGNKVQVYGEEGTVRDYVHAEDIATGIFAALEHGAVGEIYNIGTGIGATNLAILDMLRPMLAEAGARVEVERLPARSFDVKVNVLSAGKLERASGWRPRIDLAAGVHRTLDWLSTRWFDR
jgi:UDP-glucose 4-epimerase